MFLLQNFVVNSAKGRSVYENSWSFQISRDNGKPFQVSTVLGPFDLHQQISILYYTKHELACDNFVTEAKISHLASFPLRKSPAA